MSYLKIIENLTAMKRGASMKKSGNYLKSPDLFPISHSDRNIGTKGFAVIWVGMAVVLAAFAIGGAGVQSLSLGWVIVATIIGSVAIGIFMTIIGDIGIEHGLSFPVYMRAPFGTIGTHIPSLVRGVTACLLVRYQYVFRSNCHEWNLKYSLDLIIGLFAS